MKYNKLMFFHVPHCGGRTTLKNFRSNKNYKTISHHIIFESFKKNTIDKDLNKWLEENNNIVIEIHCFDHYEKKLGLEWNKIYNFFINQKGFHKFTIIRDPEIFIIKQLIRNNRIKFNISNILKKDKYDFCSSCIQELPVIYKNKSKYDSIFHLENINKVFDFFEINYDPYLRVRTDKIEDIVINDYDISMYKNRIHDIENLDFLKDIYIIKC